MTLTAIATFIAEIGVLLGVVKWVAKTYKKNAEKMELVAEGVKCQLRSDMLQIYYRHADTKTIRQYEYENFIMLYEAYKALGGNSFIDKIYNEVKTWQIIT
jgi:hypothetical protein